MWLYRSGVVVPFVTRSKFNRLILFYFPHPYNSYGIPQIYFLEYILMEEEGAKQRVGGGGVERGKYNSETHITDRFQLKAWFP